MIAISEEKANRVPDEQLRATSGEKAYEKTNITVGSKYPTPGS